SRSLPKTAEDWTGGRGLGLPAALRRRLSVLRVDDRRRAAARGSRGGARRALHAQPAPGRAGGGATNGRRGDGAARGGAHQAAAACPEASPHRWLTVKHEGPARGEAPDVHSERRGRYLMNSISEYFGSGHRSSATTCSSLSPTSRTPAIAGMTLSRM